MDPSTFALLAAFSAAAYSGAVLFLWAIFKENAAVATHRGNTVVLNSSARKAEAGLGEFVRTQWVLLSLLGLFFVSGFGFFINHVCPY